MRRILEYFIKLHYHLILFSLIYSLFICRYYKMFKKETKKSRDWDVLARPVWRDPVWRCRFGATTSPVNGSGYTLAGGRFETDSKYIPFDSSRRAESNVPENRKTIGGTSPMFGSTSPVIGSTSPVIWPTSPMFGSTSPVIGSTSP
nr:unnamed protein product [Meloidogyne enterolobii]